MNQLTLEDSDLTSVNRTRLSKTIFLCLPFVFPQEAILDIKQIRVCYLRTWFIPDVIAAFPIGYILLFAVIRSIIIRMQTSEDNSVCLCLGLTLPQQ